MSILELTLMVLHCTAASTSECWGKMNGLRCFVLRYLMLEVLQIRPEYSYLVKKAVLMSWDIFLFTIFIEIRSYYVTLASLELIKICWG